MEFSRHVGVNTPRSVFVEQSMTNAARPPADADTLLLEFLRDRDAACPLCGYNLRNLSGTTCPECRELLSLSVGFRKPRFGWFVVAIAPGIFSGICAALMMIPLVGFSLFSANPPAPWPVWILNAFGWLLVTVTPGAFSGIAAALLLIPLVGSLFFSASSPAPWPIWGVDAFGWLSGLAALVLVKYRYAFLQQPQAAQRVWAVMAWVIHIVASAAFMAAVILFQ